jgi:hypothetical protein
MQALKVWWSYSWRASILVIPLWIIITGWSLIGLVTAVENMQLSGQSLDNLNVGKLLGMLSGGVSLSILSMVLTAAIQVYAMRWTLNSRWSDFKLKAVPPDAEVAGNPATKVLP